jgi:uncharacterized LabA/DUF88 family protein
MGKVIVFIDGSNLYHGLKANIGKTKINFEKFVNKLVNGRELVRTYYYNVPINQTEDPINYKAQQRFFSRLDRISYFETILGRLSPRERIHKCPNCQHENKIIFHNEKGVDVKIAVDMLSMATKNLYDVAILVTGDGDFDKAIKEVKDLGKHVENAYFTTGHAYQLFKICDKFIELNSSFLSDCWL